MDLACKYHRARLVTRILEYLVDVGVVFGPKQCMVVWRDPYASGWWNHEDRIQTGLAKGVNPSLYSKWCFGWQCHRYPASWHHQIILTGTVIPFRTKHVWMTWIPQAWDATCMPYAWFDVTCMPQVGETVKIIFRQDWLKVSTPASIQSGVLAGNVTDILLLDITKSY